MKTQLRSGPGLTAVRVFNRYMLLFLLLLMTGLVLPQAAGAQQDNPLSPSMVLVLKLVSATRVKPATGMVVSDDGLVLVAADFLRTQSVLEDGEIVVLDGGTDISSHGRPAKVLNQSMPGGLALLSVNGLKRPGFTFSQGPLNPQTEFHLEAYPPAQYLAKGAQPLWVPLNVQREPLSKQILVSTDAPLPYVSGPIIDDCGYLAGISLATGTSGNIAGKSPRLVFADELSRMLDSLPVSLSGASCVGAVVHEPEVKEPTPGADETEPVVDEPRIAEVKETPVEEPPADKPQGTGAVTGPLAPDKLTEPALPWSKLPIWLLLPGIIIITALIWKLVRYLRAAKQTTNSTDPERSNVDVQAASDEPDTAQLSGASEALLVNPRQVADEKDLPDINDLPQGCNGWLVVEGLLETDTRFQRFCAVNTQRINVVIGRGEADISIEHPAISRAHARIESEAGLKTLSDLGSSNGTFIKDVPCLPGELMYFEAEDEIFLGNVRVRIRLLTGQVELS